MAEGEKKVDGYDVYSDSPIPSYGYDDDKSPEPMMRRFLDSFKRDPHAHIVPIDAIGRDGKVYDVEIAAQATADSPLARKLKCRHLQMIAIGGSIGTCDWFANGQPLANVCQALVSLLVPAAL
jgi:amino acid transporter